MPLASIFNEPEYEEEFSLFAQEFEEWVLYFIEKLRTTAAEA